LRIGRLLDREIVKQLCAEHYDARAFERVLAEQLPKIRDPWEQLELRRRCAGLQLALAVERGRGDAEVRRLFNKQRQLGYSSLDDEFGHLSVYCATSLGHGDARALLKEFAKKVATLRREAGFMQKAVAKALARV
jgi:hypothetical protein